MPSAPHSPGNAPRRRPGTVILVVLGLTLAFGALFASAWAAQPTVPAVPTLPPQPTQPPVPTVPPLPTQPPQPTQPPPSTEVPPTQIPPTDPPAPTEIPPTEIPATEEPTEEPTQTPEPFPSTPNVQPANQPSQPSPPQPSGPVDAGEIELTCSPVSTLATPVADAEDWDLRRCTVPLDLDGIESLDIRATSSDAGWRVILLDPDDVRTPGLLNASNSRTVVDDVNGNTAEFLLGTQRTCSALGATTLEFDIVGSARGSDAPVEATGILTLDNPSTAEATVDLATATIDASGDLPIGSFAITWQRDSAAACPWQITLTLTGVEDLDVIELSGPSVIAAVTMPGMVIITVPTESLSGEVQLSLGFSSGTPTAVGVEAQVRP